MLHLLKNVFARMKPAFKSITHGYKQFLCFFLAMLICQSFCWLLIFSNATNNANVYRTVLARYDYHFSVDGLNATDKARLQNSILNANEAGMDYTVRFSSMGEVYTAYVTVGGPAIADEGTERMYDAFLEVVLPLASIPFTTLGPLDLAEASAEDRALIEAGAPRVERSPLMTCHDEYVVPNNALSVVIAIPLAIVSTLLLMFLYHIRLDDRKFQFGIYMAFGADFRRLFGTAVIELLLLSAIALVPSFLLSLLAAALIYLPNGVELVFPVLPLLLFPVFNFAIVFLSVYLPTKRLSVKPPVRLISAEDNAGLVSSPRRSFRVFGRSFPKHYELFSFLRFRKHYIRLILTATVFAACFLCCFYLCRTYDETVGGAVEEYVISVPDNLSAEDALTDSAYVVETLNAIRGVSHVYWNESGDASANRGFMMLTSEQARRAADYTVSTSEHPNREEYTKAKYERYVDAGYRYATNAFSYTLFDRAMIDRLVDAYEVEGDPYTILDGEDRIILGDSIFNRSSFDFEPGDQILLCRFAPGFFTDGDPLLTDRAVLSAMLEDFGIHFHVYTVAAVVHGYPSENRFLAGLNASDYTAFSGREAAPEEISVYLERGLTETELAVLDGEIRAALGIVTDTGYRVSSTGKYLAATLNDEKLSTVRTALWALLILLLSPLVWLFSEALFFGRREKELRILRALGAYGEDVRGIALFSGVLLAVGAALTTLLEGLLLNYLLFAFCNYFLAGFGIIEGVRYTFSVSFAALAVAVVTSALFGFLSSYLPYLSYRKREERTLAYIGTDISPDGVRGDVPTETESEVSDHGSE